MIACFLISIYGAYGIGFIQAGRLGRRWSWKVLAPALGLWLIVAVPTLVQLTVWPHLQFLLGRNADEILHHRQLWRLATAVVVQDGGKVGATGNLVSLALLAPLTALLWNSRMMILAFVSGALSGELAGLAWQPIGAGNSVGCCGLAAAILVYTFVAGTMPFRLAAAVIAIFGLLQLAVRDIHGAAFAVGLAVMSLTAYYHRPQTSVTKTPNPMD